MRREKRGMIEHRVGETGGVSIRERANPCEGADT